jgi:small nuclear ribonucleoprotein (snRNP)-like protein
MVLKDVTEYEEDSTGSFKTVKVDQILLNGNGIVMVSQSVTQPFP